MGKYVSPPDEGGELPRIGDPNYQIDGDTTTTVADKTTLMMEGNSTTPRDDDDDDATVIGAYMSTQV